ncbi:hypothetical protein LTR66_014378 [Elasticomyces elasticus]|nr:hypothetical protein LTR66_014378 [Elasticomyces elasticus]KAK4984556.1 hypothetical protein LTR50_006520 [Elasticomyces elasticus]
MSTTNRNLSFVDETRELVSIYDRGSEPEFSATTPLEWTESTFSTLSASYPPLPGNQSASPSTSRPAPTRLDSTGGHSLSDVSSPTKRRRLTFGSSFQGSPEDHSAPFPISPTASHHAPSRGPYSTSPIGGAHDQPIDSSGFSDLEPTASHATDLGAGFSAVSETLSKVYLDAPIWPLQDREEARLLRYFVENLASSFDLTDPLDHFKTIVPQKAALCPTLLNAVFAASARHLSRVSDYDPLISNRYHQECLKHLIPMLDDTAAILDENLLASTVILRYLEEIEVPLSGQLHAEGQGHLLGTHVFISAQERSAVTGGLRQAAFWVGVRQEIYVAFVNQRSIIPPLQHCNIDRSFEPADDCTWANRIVAHAADVIRYCFGEGEHSHAHYNQLRDYCTDWFAFKPASYSPIFWQDYDDDLTVFPEIWFLSDAIVTGLQHFYLAKILLSAHNPKIPKLGPGRAAALRAMDEEIRHDVKILCGMASSNLKSPPNLVTASMAIAMAGDKFARRREQEACLEILRMTERLHAWPTTTAQENLKESWGWIGGE